MNWTTRCAAVIPCLNEARHIAQAVESVRQFVPTVFVIDDGSRDGTASIAKNAGAQVLRNAASRGKGAALQAGWKQALQCGFDWALTMDGDGQHAAKDAPKFLEVAERAGAELVIGNRMANPAGMPWLRRTVNRWLSARISTLAGMPLPDSQCGFRLMNLHAWNQLRVEAAHFEIESDLLLAFARAGRAIQFVPIEVIYRNECSKIHPVRDTMRWIGWWRKARRQGAKSNSRRIVAAEVPNPGANLLALRQKNASGVDR